MNKQEAEEYLKWYDDKTAEYDYLAHFKSSRPFPIDFPGAGVKRQQAKIVLGKHDFQHTYKQMVRVYPFENLTIEKYNSMRKELGIV